MNSLKYLILVIVFICYACAKSNDKTIPYENLEISEETISDDFEPHTNEIDLADKSPFYINNDLILQKLNELVELNSLYKKETKFKPEIQYQISNIIENDSVLINLPESILIKELKQTNSYKSIDDSTKLINFTYNVKGKTHYLTAKITTIKTKIEGMTVLSQQVKFTTKE
ncbi:hypothetical protein [Pseudofulvibacter geojedonensis]|uniref:Lipoprotein n=1 Tax=Pseudofulvibacter geojedonensis TaxID=1123758 RepID=A0ABW3I508_9FLAO